MTTLLLPPIVAAGVVTDSLGREWDPLEHPRGRDGKFIRTFHMIRAFLNIGDSEPWMTGEVQAINPDGSVRVKVTKTVDPALKDPTSGQLYVGHTVDVTPDRVESVNEKAKLQLDVYGKPMPGGADKGFEEYDFSPEVMRNFGKRAGFSDAEMDDAAKAAAAYKNGSPNPFTVPDKYHLALYAKSVSGDGREKSNDNFLDVLDELGVPQDVTDDTPDGLSGLQYLADQVNDGRSPNNNNLASNEWVKEVPPTREGSIREAVMSDNANVRLVWNDDGTQGIVDPKLDILSKFKPGQQADASLIEYGQRLKKLGAYTGKGYVPNYSDTFTPENEPDNFTPPSSPDEEQLFDPAYDSQVESVPNMVPPTDAPAAFPHLTDDVIEWDNDKFDISAMVQMVEANGDNPDVNLYFMEALDEAIGFDDEKSGLRYHVTSAYGAQTEAGDGIIFHTELTDSSGNVVGEGKRVIHRDINDQLSIYLDELKIDEAFQGQGVGSKQLSKLRSFARAAGIDNFQMFADMSIGGYAWARTGADWESPDSFEVMGFLSSAQQSLNNWADSLDEDEFNHVKGQIDGLMARAQGPEENLPTPYEISRIGDDVPAFNGQHPGKTALVGSDWYGRIDLNDQRQITHSEVHNSWSQHFSDQVPADKGDYLEDYSSHHLDISAPPEIQAHLTNALPPIVDKIGDDEETVPDSPPGAPELAPEPKPKPKKTPKAELPGDEEDDFEAPEPEGPSDSDLEDIEADDEVFNEFNREGIDDVVSRLRKQPHDDAEDQAAAIEAIANNYEEGNLSREEAFAQINEISWEVYHQGEDDENEDLKQLSIDLDAAFPDPNVQEGADDDTIEPDEGDVDEGPTSEEDSSPEADAGSESDGEGSDDVEAGPAEGDTQEEAGFTSQHVEIEGDPPTEDELDALKNYKGVGFIDVNSWLRALDNPDLADMADFYKEDTSTQKNYDGLMSLMNRSKLSANTTLYRGVSREDFEPSEWDAFVAQFEDNEGGTFQDAGFLSTTRDPDVADNFARSGEDKFGIVFELEVPAGHNAIDAQVEGNKLVGLHGEKEIILSPNSKFVIDSFEAEYGGWRVYAHTTYDAPKEADIDLPEQVDEPQPDVDEAAEYSDLVDTPKKFQVLDDPGTSGDGYYATTDGSKLWGKYGAAGVLVRNVDDNGTERFLMVQRGTWVSTNVGKWQLPGGALNSNENDYQGTARELNEELVSPDGWLDNLHVTGEVNFEHPSGWHYNNIAADHPEMFEPTPDGQETGDAKWVTREELAQLELHPALAKNLDEILGKFPQPEKKIPLEIPDTDDDTVGAPAALHPTDKVDVIGDIDSGDLESLMAEILYAHPDEYVDGSWVELPDDWYLLKNGAGWELHDNEDGLKNTYYPADDSYSVAGNVRGYFKSLIDEPNIADEPGVDVIDTVGWSKVGGQGGSNMGGMFESPNGNRYYVKRGKSADHARNEALAASFYDAADVASAQQLLADTPWGGLGTASPEIPNAKQDLSAHLSDEDYLDKIREGFAVDAWLANWDVAGLVFDNVVSDENGNPVRVDPGGALFYRAQGAPKGHLFSDNVSELDTLRDPGMNPQSSKIFGGMTEEEMRLSAQKVVNISPELIDSLVDSVGFGDGEVDPEMIKTRLKKRREFIAERFGLDLPENNTPDIGVPDVAQENNDPWAIDAPAPSPLTFEPDVTPENFEPTATYQIEVNGESLKNLPNLDTQEIDEVLSNYGVSIIDEEYAEPEPDVGFGGYKTYLLEGQGADLKTVWDNTDRPDDEFYGSVVKTGAAVAPLPEEEPLADWEKELLNGVLPETDDSLKGLDTPEASGDDGLPGPESEDWVNMVDSEGEYRWNGSGQKLRIGDEVTGAKGLVGKIYKFQNNNKGVEVKDAAGKKYARHRATLDLVNPPDDGPDTTPEPEPTPDAPVFTMPWKPGMNEVQNLGFFINGLKAGNYPEGSKMEFPDGHTLEHIAPATLRYEFPDPDDENSTNFGDFDMGDPFVGDQIMQFRDQQKAADFKTPDWFTHFSGHTPFAWADEDGTQSILTRDTNGNVWRFDDDPNKAPTPLGSYGDDETWTQGGWTLYKDDPSGPVNKPKPTPKASEDDPNNKLLGEAHDLNDYNEVVAAIGTMINKQWDKGLEDGDFVKLGSRFKLYYDEDDDRVKLIANDLTEVVDYLPGDLHQQGIEDDIHNAMLEYNKKLSPDDLPELPDVGNIGQTHAFNEPGDAQDHIQIMQQQYNAGNLNNWDSIDLGDGWSLQHFTSGNKMVLYHGGTQVQVYDSEQTYNNPDFPKTVLKDMGVDLGSPDTPVYDSVAELAKVNNIPKKMPDVKKESPYFMTDYEATQYRNAGFALDDASKEVVDSPAWNNAVNKAIWNLNHAGQYGQDKLQEVSKWRTDTLNAAHGGVIDGPKVSNLGPGYADLPEGSMPMYKYIGSVPSSQGSIVVQDSHGGLAFYGPNGSVVKSVLDKDSFDSAGSMWEPYKPADLDKVSLPAGYPDIPDGYSPKYVFTSTGSDPEEVYALAPDNGSGPIKFAYKNGNIFDSSASDELLKNDSAWKPYGGHEVSVAPGVGDTPGPDLSKPHRIGGDGHPIFIGDEVIAEKDGLKYKVKSFQNNDKGVGVVHPVTGKTHYLHRLKLKSTNPANKSSQPANKSAPTLPNSGVTVSKVDADPSSPWYGKEKPSEPEAPAALDADAKIVSDDWLVKADENYKKRMLTNNPSWTEKPLSSSSTYQEYLNVQKGDKIALGALLAKGRITQEMHDEALAQIQPHLDSVKDIQAKHTAAMAKWRDDIRDWRKANGFPTIELKGMKDDVVKLTDEEAYTYFNKHYQAPGLSSQAKSAVISQKGSNISYGLRNAKEKTLDPQWIADHAGYDVLNMDKAMLEAPAVKEDFITIRTFEKNAFVNPQTGSSYLYSEDLTNLVGSIQHDWGFAETSPGSFDVGAEPGYDQGEVRMQVRVPKGTRGVWTLAVTNSHSDERGFILERGIAYYIHGVEYKYNKWYVDAEIIPKDVNYDEFGHFINNNPFFD